MLNFDRLRVKFSAELCKINENYFTDKYAETISVPKIELVNRIGLNKLQFDTYNNIVIVDFTGKINAKKGYLGFINKKNIQDTLEKIKSYGYVNYNSEDILEKSIINTCHVTKDINCNDIPNFIFKITKHVKLNCDKQTIINYPNGGISINPVPLSRKDKLIIYPKVKELEYSSNMLYRTIVGQDFLEQNPDLLRFELQLEDTKCIRRFFNMKQNQKIILKDLLNSSENPLIEKMTELRITEVK